MPSTYSTRLRLELIGTGEQTGSWGNTTNINLGTLIEESISGIASVTVADSASPTALTSVNGGTDQARQMIINLTGGLTAAREVTCPNVQKLYFVRNGTSGGFPVTFKPTTGTGISIPNGRIRAVYCDATNVLDLITDLSTSTQIAGADIATTSTAQTLLSKTLTSPRVGTAILDTNGNELIAVTATGSAVNEITVTNAATTGTPTISATGGDTNIGLNLVSKGSGSVFVNSVPAVTTTGTQTLTNKTLSSPSITNPSITNSGLLTLPAGPDTIVGRATTDTLTNKTLDSTNILNIRDDRFTLQDDGDLTKQLRFQLNPLSTATTRVLTAPAADGTIITTADAANQAAMEAASSTTTFVSPGNAKFHPGVAKAWIFWNATGTPAINASLNIGSITDNGVGDQTLNFTTAFSSANYNVSQQASSTTPDTGWYLDHQYNTAGKAAGSFRVYMVAGNYGGSGVNDHVINNMSFFGDQ